MFRASPTDPSLRAILLWLSDLDRRGGGYELRGVRGWTPSKDIAAALKRRITDELQRLAERNLVDRENLALPRRESAFWMYRINARGAELAGVEPPREPGPAEVDPPPRMVFSDSQWAALLFMRAATTRPPARFYPQKEMGWRTIKEVRDGERGFQIWPEDVYQLERGGLVEKRSGEGVARTRPIVFYRVTEIGEQVQRLEPHRPAPAEEP